MTLSSLPSDLIRTIMTSLNEEDAYTMLFVSRGLAQTYLEIPKKIIIHLKTDQVFVSQMLTPTTGSNPILFSPFMIKKMPIAKAQILASPELKSYSFLDQIFSTPMTPISRLKIEEMAYTLLPSAISKYVPQKKLTISLPKKGISESPKKYFVSLFSQLLKINEKISIKIIHKEVITTGFIQALESEIKKRNCNNQQQIDSLSIRLCATEDAFLAISGVEKVASIQQLAKDHNLCLIFSGGIVIKKEVDERSLSFCYITDLSLKELDVFIRKTYTGYKNFTIQLIKTIHALSEYKVVISYV